MKKTVLVQLTAFILSLAVMLGGIDLMAQGNETNSTGKASNSKNYGGFGYFMLGYHSFNLSEMNTALKDHGYPELSNGSMSIGGGGHYLVKNWLLGGEGFGLPGSRVENDEYIVSHTGGYGFFDIGYLVVKTPSFFLYPILGIGGGGMTVNLKEKDEQTTVFGDILENPGRETNMDNSGFMLNFSFLANYMIYGEKEDTYSGGFILGIKAGYILNLDGNNWYQNQDKLTQTPSSGISGPYVTLVFGGGGSSIK